MTLNTSAEAMQIQQTSPHGQFEVKEHITFCFTCISNIGFNTNCRKLVELFWDIQVGKDYPYEYTFALSISLSKEPQF